MSVMLKCFQIHLLITVSNLFLYSVYIIKLNVLMFDLSFTNNSTLNNPATKQLYPVLFF